MEEEILRLAKAVAAATEEEEALLASLCAAASAEVRARLGEGMTAGDCGEAYVCAAAWLAAAALEGTRGSGFSALRAGEITLTASDTQEHMKRSAALRREAWVMLEPYLGSGTFCFREVRG